MTTTDVLTPPPAVPPGLKGVQVTDTTIGDVRGTEGFYHYPQYSATALAATRSLEDVWRLLFEGALPATAAEDLLEIVMRRYERASTVLTSNRPVEDWGKLLGDAAAVTAMLDRLLHHAHILKCGPRSWRTKLQTDLQD